MLSNDVKLLKWNWVQVDPEDSRIIDNNHLVEEKLASRDRQMRPISLGREMEGEPQEEDSWADTEDQGIGFSTDDDFEPGEFRGGLDVTDLGGILDDSDDPSTIIKAAPPMDEPAPYPVYDGPSPEELIEQAQAEVDEMYRKAQAEIDFLKKQATEEGRAAGNNQGYSEGLARADAELSQKMAQLEADYQQKIRDLEPEFVKQLCGIYEHIFHVKLSDYQSLVMQLIETCMMKLEGSGSYIIHVSTEDYPYVGMQKKSLQESLGNRNATLDVVEDTTLKKNECTIETEGGIYDCSLDSQLFALRRELMTLSYQGEE